MRVMESPAGSDRPFSVGLMDGLRAREALAEDSTAYDALRRADETGILFASRFGKSLAERALILVCERCDDVGWIAEGSATSYPAMKADLEGRVTASKCEHWKVYVRVLQSR